MWIFGLVYSFMGVVGILLTYKIHKFEKYRAKTFYLVDFLIACIASILVGFVSNLFIGIGIFILLGCYYRIRRILTDIYLLKTCPTQNLKATYLSMYAFFASLNTIWVPLILGYLIGKFGIRSGYMLFGLIFFVLLSSLYLYIFRKNKKLFDKSFFNKHNKNSNNNL